MSELTWDQIEAICRLYPLPVREISDEYDDIRDRERRRADHDDELLHERYERRWE